MTIRELLQAAAEGRPPCRECQCSHERRELPDDGHAYERMDIREFAALILQREDQLTSGAYV